MMQSSKSNRASKPDTAASKGKGGKKQKKQKSLLGGAAFGGTAWKVKSLQTLHEGKRILLRAKDVYRNVPDGEDDFLFQ